MLGFHLRLLGFHLRLWASTCGSGCCRPALEAFLTRVLVTQGLKSSLWCRRPALEAFLMGVLVTQGLKSSLVSRRLAFEAFLTGVLVTQGLIEALVDDDRHPLATDWLTCAWPPLAIGCHRIRVRCF